MIFNLIKNAKQLFIDKTKTGVEADNVEDAISVLNSNLSLGAETITFTDENNGGRSINLILYRRAGVVAATLQGVLSPNNANTNHNLVGEIPENLRPLVGVYVDVLLINNNSIKGNARFTINSSGKISYTASTTGMNEFHTSMAWVVNSLK